MILLILDLDETLVHATEGRLDRAPDFFVGPYSVYKRPGVAEFLDSVQRYFLLAIWTSSTRAYAEPVVHNIFPPDIALQFLWARERCTLRFNQDKFHYEWTKNLSKLKRQGYKLEQVLVADDTPEKLFKHYGNLVRVKPWWGDLDDRELSQLAPYLISLSQSENVRKIEKRFWRKKSKD